MNAATRHVPRHYKKEISDWLQEHRFTHFITLTTHDPSISVDGMNNRLKQWDARVNRGLYGPKWARHKDELIWFFAFLESPETNPHWHLLLRLDDSPVIGNLVDTKRLEVHTRRVWSKLAPGGTVDIQEIHGKIDAPLVDYVGKQLGFMTQYTSFKTPDEFR